MSNREKLPVDASNHLQVALLVREKIRNPENWTQNAYIRNVEGKEIKITESGAQSTCLIGAAVLATGVNSAAEVERGSGFVEFLGFQNAGQLIEFNDNHTHAEVIALLDTAIEKHLGPEPK